jgi:Fic family protein
MRIPRNPPDIDSMMSDGQRSKDILSDEVREYAKDFNDRYLHWSEVRNRDTGRFDPDVVWARMKLVRGDCGSELVFGSTHYRYCLTERVWTMLRMFDARANKGFSQGDDVLNSGAYHPARTLMEESIASSQAEGAVTTTKKAIEMLCHNIRPKDRSERMIVNNYRAMLYIKDHTDLPLTPQLIKDIHRIVADGTMEGRFMGAFRDNDDVVVQDSLTGEVFHQPIPKEEIECSVEQLCGFINGNDSLHPVIKGMILHYAVAYIHPFEDGNGRVARSLFYWYTLKSGYGIMEYLAISRYIRDHKGRYEGSYIFGETDGNDMTYFMLYNLKALEDSMDTFEGYLERRTEEENVMRTRLSGYGLNERQTGIFTGLMNGEDISVRSVMNQYGVSLNTARADIAALIDAGLIIETGREVNSRIYSWSGRKV